MSTYRFIVGQRFKWKDRMFEVERVLADRQIVITDLMTGVAMPVSLDELILALAFEQLMFTDNLLAQKPAGIDVRDLDDYSPFQLEAAHFRKTIVERALALPVNNRRQAIAALVVQTRAEQQVKKDSGQQTISLSSVYEWIAAYEGADHDIRALIPHTDQRGGKGQPRLTDEVEKIILAVIQEKYLAVRENTTGKTLLYEINARIREANQLRSNRDFLEPVSLSTVKRRLEATDMKARFTAKHGTDAAKKRYKQFSQTTDPIYPL